MIKQIKHWGVIIVTIATLFFTTLAFLAIWEIIDADFLGKSIASLSLVFVTTVLFLVVEKAIEGSNNKK